MRTLGVDWAAHGMPEIKWAAHGSLATKRAAHGSHARPMGCAWQPLTWGCGRAIPRREAGGWAYGDGPLEDLVFLYQM